MKTEGDINGQVTDIEIFPHRLLGCETTEKLLTDLGEIAAVNRIVLHGRQLPVDEMVGEPRFMTIKGEKISLYVKTGRILMEIKTTEVEDPDSFHNEIREMCSKHLPFGFNMSEGTFIRKQKTVTDSIKYGENMPDELIGLTDQNVLLTERTTMIKK
ncbi:methyl-coenzyme M reductase operon protein D [Methanobacterium sp.]|uniref:methyl-coenzyme M reductase operon protein D n=1 Tax=Methanobacterium sp. TaxID=2164 RepID=UPI00257A6A76|nr:methyl-coenzyme M reductase operon protein D [Methanobacterium sp.]